ncbi:MAG: cytochrome c biogenesis protein CcdA [Chloroflexi bacterium]|nr:cytochrome c biogenesis protein CcdA [Chloroflexota bacterium]
MISAVNPCGFTMLPAYFGLYLGTGSPQARSRSPIRQFGQALLVGLTVTAGFMLLFAVVGISIGAGAQFVVDAFPWIGLAIGVLLLAAGGWLLAGGTLYNAIGDRLAARIGDPSQASVRGYFLFGLSYGTASLSCTLPIFITVIGGSIALADFLPSVGQFVLYGLGMGAVILALTLSMALFKAALVEKLRRAMVFFQPLSAALMLAAGAFIIYYWLTFGELLDSFT